MDPTLIPQIINALLVIGGITMGGVTLEHLLENYAMAKLPQNLKTVFPTLTAYVGTVLTRMATGTPLGSALSDLPSIVLPLIMAGIAHSVHGTAIGATPVSVSTPPPPSATPPDPPVVNPLKAAALLIGFLLLAVSARATSLEYQVPINPAAGASYISNTFVLAPTAFKWNAGRLTPDLAGYLGAQSTWQWGSNYGLGVTVGVVGQNIASDPTNPSLQGLFAGGIAADWIGVELAGVWSVDGFRGALTKPF
jgi:hypothetical protein